MDYRELQHQEELLTQYRANVRRLEQQAARYGEAEVPLQLQNALAGERRRVVETESKLRDHYSSQQAAAKQSDEVKTGEVQRNAQSQEEWTIQILGITIWKARWTRIVTLLVQPG